MSKDNLIERFNKEIIKVNGECFVFKNIDDSITQIQSFIKKEKIKKILINDKNEISRSIYVNLKRTTDLIIQAVSEINIKNKDIKEELKDVDLGISYANFLIADTGSVVLTSSEDEPRLLSLLPEFNIVLSTSNEIIEKLEDAIDLIKTEKCVTVITGPSRTADIEKVLITGVHGPKKLIVFIFDK